MIDTKLPDGFDDGQALLKRLKTEPEKDWITRGEKNALELFHQMAKRVPAYKEFLKEHKFDASSVNTIEDFDKIPSVDKDNYLRKYDRKDLCWDGEFDSKSWVISATSGSTGKPYYFPRNNLQDDMYTSVAEAYLLNNFSIDTKSTLFVDAFAMGAWIGGVFTYQAIKNVADKGYKLSIITPGIIKEEVINAVKELGSEFDQVIIGCYPPILKDIIDHGIAEGVDWPSYNLGIVFSAEGFNEVFRDYIIEKGGLKDPVVSSLNHYGTVDLGTMSVESPLSIAMRREILTSEKLYEGIFKQTKKLPTLTQYIPELFYFEEDNGKLYCSSSSGIPLVRYDLKDNGGVMTKAEVEEVFKASGKEVATIEKEYGIADKTMQLPFVYVYERSDFSVTFLGFQVYPEPVKKAVSKKEYLDLLTGKFTLESMYDDAAEPHLYIHLELQNGKKMDESLQTELLNEIIQLQCAENADFAYNYQQNIAKTTPELVFWNYQDPKYFSGRGKQQWVKK